MSCTELFGLTHMALYPCRHFSPNLHLQHSAYFAIRLFSDLTPVFEVACVRAMSRNSILWVVLA